MEYKMIATDLDGTLLSKDQTINEKNLSAMKMLKESGVVTVINTGRTFNEMPRCVINCPYADYFICSNGTVIYDSSKKELFKQCLDDNLFIKVFELLSGYSTNMNIHERGIAVIDADKANTKCWREHNASEYTAASFMEFCTPVDDFYNYHHENTGMEMICCYFKYPSELKECLGLLKQIPQIQTAASSEYNIEVFNANVSKGKAVIMLANTLGFDISEVIVAGDSPNDLPMFETGAHSIAVSNAMEKVKTAADEIGCSNEQGIMDYILNRYYI